MTVTLHRAGQDNRRTHEINTRQMEFTLARAHDDGKIVTSPSSNKYGHASENRERERL